MIKFRYIRILLYSVSVIVVLLLSLYALLRSSVVQTYLTHHIVIYLSKELNTTASVGGVDIELFNTVVLEDVYIEDLHDDTLLYANRLKINIEDIDFGGHQLKLDKIVLENTCFNLKKYKSEDHLNLQFIIDALKSDDTLKSKWELSCNAIELINSAFSYRNEHKPLIKRGMNYHDINASDIYVKISDIRINSDTIWGDIESLSCKEKSGFILKDFAANVKSTPVGLFLDSLTIKTPSSNIKTQFSFQYAAYRDFLEFTDKVRMMSDFDKSEVAFDDIAWFVPGLYGLSEKVTLSGLVQGKISRLKGKNIDIAFGRSSRFHGNFSLTGLPNIRETFIHLKVKELRTRQSDLRRLHMPPFIENKHLKIPEIIASLGNIKFRGEFTGFYNDFVAYGDFITDIGQFSSDVSLKEDALTEKVRYSGSLASNDFDAGVFLNLTDHLGKTGFDVHIDGSGFTKDDVEAHLKGVIRNIEFNNYNYRNVDIEGDLADRRFNGMVSVNDENIDLDFNGKIDFTKTPPVFDFRATIGNANLTALNFDKRDTVSYLSATMIYNFSGDDIDNMEGKLNINNIIYQLGEEVSELGDLKLVASGKDGARYLQLNSDFADAEINGSFRMEYLMGSFNKLLHLLLPSIKVHPTTLSLTKGESQGGAFEFSIHLKNTETLSRLFLPDVRLSSNTRFSGTYDEASNLLVLKGRSPEIDLYGKRITQWYIDAKTENDPSGQIVLYLNTGCDQLSFTDLPDRQAGSIWVENFNIQTRSGNDSILFGILWENESPPAGPALTADKQVYSGDVNGCISFKAGGEVVFSFLSSEIVIADSIWTINLDNKIIYDSTSISITGIVISNNNQQIKIEGAASQDSAGGINVQLSNIQLANLNPITSKYKFDLKGIVNGNTTISNIYSDPVFSGKIDVVDLELNKNKLGKATIVSNWDNNNKTIQVFADVTRGQLKMIEVKGNYNLSRKDNPMDFDIELQKLRMNLFEPFVEGVFSNIKGIVTGNLRLIGSLSEPLLTGRIKLQKTGFMIDYINTRYSFAHDINFYENRISFNNLILNDSKGNRAVVNGNIYHDYFKNIKFDIKADAENLYCLNTDIKQNDLYYGEAYATGQIGIEGGVKDIVIDVSATTQKDSRIFIPLTGTEVVSENRFITFVHSSSEFPEGEGEPTRRPSTYPKDGRGGLAGINIALEITPDAEVQLIFDEKVGDIIKGRGNGNLKMTVSNSGDFSMFGVFVIEEGEYLFTLQNIINKRFDIEKGGNVRWNGDPYDADINLNAIYPLKASLYGLTLDSTDRRRVPVECKLQMKGKLLTPEIGFDIKLPKADENTRSSVNSLITTEQQMNKQIFSLLILGSFQPAEKFDAGGGVGANTSEVLSNQLSNWLSQISEDFDIGVNYRPGDDITDKEVELALSTQLFDDRLTINGSVANNPNASNTNASNIVGDFDLDYKITEDGKLRIKAFNRSNDYILTTDNTPYKQGVGIFYRKEFNSFRDLFRRSKLKSPNP